MKRVFILIVAIVPVGAIAGAPSTSCPSGYITVVEEYMDIADSSCQSEYTPAGTADSCLVSNPSGSCIMYAPTGISYTDASGTYEYTVACAME